MTLPDYDAPLPKVDMPQATGQLIGYCRRSTGHQTLDHQHDRLATLGITKYFDDTMSGARDDRPGLAAMLEYVRPGDTVVVVALDRLGRTISGIFRTVETLSARGIHVRTLRESIDTSTDIGLMLMSIFAGIAHYERTLIAERAAAARESAERRGKRAGRPRKLDNAGRRMLVAAHQNKESVPDLMAQFKLGRATVYEILRDAENRGVTA